jgi:hypothetical protein
MRRIVPIALLLGLVSSMLPAVLRAEEDGDDAGPTARDFAGTWEGPTVQVGAAGATPFRGRLVVEEQPGNSVHALWRVGFTVEQKGRPVGMQIEETFVGSLKGGRLELQGKRKTITIPDEGLRENLRLPDLAIVSLRDGSLVGRFGDGKRIYEFAYALVSSPATSPSAFVGEHRDKVSYTGDDEQEYEFEYILRIEDVGGGRLRGAYAASGKIARGGAVVDARNDETFEGVILGDTLVFRSVTNRMVYADGSVGMGPEVMVLRKTADGISTKWVSL